MYRFKYLHYHYLPLLLLLQATISARGASGQAATITLGAASGYSGTATPTVTLTGLNIAFASQSPDPNQGLDVFLSDQLASNVKDTVNKNCADQSSITCHQSVQAVLQSRDVELETRQMGVIAVLAGAVVLFISIVIPHLDSSGKTVPNPIHLGAPDISQISSIGSATVVQVATAATGVNDFPVTEAPAPTAAQGPIPSISTASAASGNLQAGDVVLTIPSDLARRVSDFLAMTAPWRCSAYKKVKRGDYDAGCLQSQAEELIENAMPGRAFDSFFYMQGVPVQIGNTAKAEYVQALNAARNFAIGLAAQLQVDQKAAAAVGLLAFGLVYLLNVDGKSITDEVVFQASEVATPTGPITNAPSLTLTSGCPSGAPKTDGDDPLCCQDKTCQGDGTTRTCVTGKYSGCQCLNLVTYPPVDQYDTDLGSSQLSLFATIFAMNAAPPASSTTTPPPPSSTTAPPPPYATGTCSFHLTETQDCESDKKNLFAIINLKDGAGNDIGDTSVDPDKNPFGEGINAGSSYSFTSKLPNPLVVTGEHKHDYIQFTYGGLSWQSKTPNGGAHCNNGGWDPRGGPVCDSRFGNQKAVNNMDCFFPC